MLNHKRIRLYRTTNVDIDGRNLPVSVDGHPIQVGNSPLRIDIEKEEINFIIE
jgi:hypothetical protein